MFQLSVRKGGLGLLLLAGLTAQAQPKHTFEIKDGQFRYDGQPTQLHWGEVHYARVPKEYWRHRLKILKALVINTVATYAFGNYHHPTPGGWDFKTGSHNRGEFLKTAQEEGLFVILRPGPYACAEWVAATRGGSSRTRAWLSRPITSLSWTRATCTCASWPRR